LDGKNVEYAFEMVVEEVSKITLLGRESEIKKEDHSKGLMLDTNGNKNEQNISKKSCCNN
jgi:hypothetical protein